MITGNLEYVMSSFPHLSFQDSDEESSRVSSIFKKYGGAPEEQQSIITILDKEAQKFLTPKKFRVFQGLTLECIHEEDFQKSNYEVLAAFSRYRHTLKKGLYELRRNRKKGAEASPVQKQALPLVPGTPLQEEIQLLKWQWEKLEALSIGHYADFGALVLYKLKLLLLLRWWGFDQKQGLATFLDITKKDGIWRTKS